jgi:putative aldouronate transport system permease protein
MDVLQRKNADKYRKKWDLKIIYEQRYLFLMSVPFLIWLIIFKYVPLWGWSMAFQNYKPARSFFEQEWVGFKHFIDLFREPQFYLVMRNTLSMSFLGLVFGFTAPILFAILLNEIRNIPFKRTIQTVSYLPHFVSWVIAGSLILKMLSVDGVLNDILLALGIITQPVQFMAMPKAFWFIATFAEIWKEMGWNSIIYLAAITGIDTELYEAAKVDGAGRFRQIWHITLPGIRSTIIVILIMSIGWLINIGFEKQFILGNPLVNDYAEVLDLYVLNYGVRLGRYSYGTAIGIFKSVVSIALLLFANQFAKKIGEGRIL